MPSLFHWAFPNIFSLPFPPLNKVGAAPNIVGDDDEYDDNDDDEDTLLLLRWWWDDDDGDDDDNQLSNPISRIQSIQEIS